MKRKSIAAGVSCLGLLFFVFSFLFLCGSMPSECVRAESMQLTCKSMTIIKGQYAFAGLTGAAVPQKTAWSVTGDCIRIHKASGAGEAGGYCYIRAVKTGTAVLECRAGRQSVTCRVKVLPAAAFTGDFTDRQEEVYLHIFKNDDTYAAFYSQVRLAQMDWLTGTVENGILTLKGSDPAGDPVTITVSKKGKKRILTFEETSWEYFQQGSTIPLKKCSGKKGYEQAMSGFGSYYHAYF